MHEDDDLTGDLGRLLADRPEPRAELRARILEACNRERSAVLDRGRRRYRTAWLSLAACAMVLSLVDVGVDRRESTRVAALLQKNPPIASPSVVAALRIRNAGVLALLREPDAAAGIPAGLRGAAAPALPAFP